MWKYAWDIRKELNLAVKLCFLHYREAQKLDSPQFQNYYLISFKKRAACGNKKDLDFCFLPEFVTDLNVILNFFTAWDFKDLDFIFT